MSAALFYVDALPEIGELAVVDGDEGFHAANVRRIRPGEELDLGDGAGRLAHCVVEEVAKGRLTARVLDRRIVPLAAPSVTVVQALPKSDRSELAIELATEAGADAFVAWQASRCVARWDGQEKVDKGLRRWARWPGRRPASRGARTFPSISGVVSTAELVRRMRDAGATALVLHESATGKLTERACGASGFAAACRRSGGWHRRRGDRGAGRCGGDSGAARADGTAHVDGRGRRIGRAGRAHAAVVVSRPAALSIGMGRCPAVN